MKKLFFLVLLFALSSEIIVSTVLAEETAKKGTDTKEEQKTEEFSFDDFLSRVHTFTLDNGLRVIFFKRDYAPIFTANIWVKVGGVDERLGETGLSHFLEHMAFKGSKTIGTSNYKKERELLDELDKIVSSNDVNKEKGIEEINSQLSLILKENEYSKLYKERGAVGLNAGTSKDFTYYTVSLPSNAFLFWCWMESDKLLNPVFREFYKEREVIREERRTRTDDNPFGKLYEALMSTAYQSHPYRFPTIGWPYDMEKLSRSQMRALYKKYYRPDNMVISIVGDLEFEDVKRDITLYFSRLKKPSIPLPKITAKEEPQKGLRRVEVEFNASPSFLIGYHKPVYPNENDIKFSVLHSILSEGASSILHKELVLEKKLLSSCYTSEGPGERFPSLFIVGGTVVDGVTPDQAIEAIQNIFDRLKKTEVSDKQLEAAKRKVMVSLLNNLSHNSSLSYILGKSELLYNSPKLVIKIYKSIEKMTKEDIKSISKLYLNKSNRTDVFIKSIKENINKES